MKKTGPAQPKGFALTTALLMLLVVTLIGLGAIITGIFETSIAGNDRLKSNAFYVSEAGSEVALGQLPISDPINPTPLGEGTSYWSGSPSDKSAPKSLEPIGYVHKAGFDSNWGFKRFQINTTGQSFQAFREVEVQAIYGPMSVSTRYNN